MSTKWKDGVAIRGKKVYIRAEVNGVKEMGPAKNYMHLLKPHEPVPTTITDGKRLRARVIEWVLKGRPTEPPSRAADLVGNDLIDRWLESRAVTMRRRKKAVRATDASEVRRARAAFGELPLSAWEQPETLRGFVAAQLDAGYQIATPNRILSSVIRPAIYWALEQPVPLLSRSPFGRHRFQIDIEAENKRTERCAPDHEARLLEACATLASPEFHRCGEALADFIILAIDTGARSDEIHGLTTTHVDWHSYTLTLRLTKRGEARLVPFNPAGRVATILQRRRFAGTNVPIIPVGKLYRAWVHAVCLANGIAYVQTGRGGRPTAETIAAYKAVNLRPHDLRHEAATWWGLCGIRDEDREFLQGHRSQTMQGRYSHEKLLRARQELAAKVWPREHERAVKEQPAVAQA